ncbi:DNA ligase D [Ramlibacter rhizophilus]|uniref:DNA ligase (ATP) n=1 Tax=Ramlibacter rhizophilus TaxID=1781167 RepID=A0A4Z0BJU2_9BURK|nr:DNA ligase D [Ramlibacter rhizophilus]TFY99585.1 DNA ligase D [Ramlibacter rhizophilus]
MADDRTRSALKTYRDKRDFARTPEPAEGGAANEAARAFVIQKHWARRLHYDFRLELDGTMKSWAVPKGPSLDPADKRMAQPTEDHPIAYNAFEGEIPAGNYGAGKVIIWDKGSWHPLQDPREGYAQGKLKFELRGHKLQGAWTLVRMKGKGQGRTDPWLLIKERDARARPAAEYSIVDERPESVQHLADLPTPTPAPGASRPRAGRDPAPTDRPPPGAKAAPLPAALAPQLAVLAEAPPPADGPWLYEIKFDGYRLLARAEGGAVRLFTRNGNDWTRRLAPLREWLEGMALPDGWYDGEIIMPGTHAPADFQALQGAFDTPRIKDIVYYLFDLPWCAGHDLRGAALEHRREVLQRIVTRKPHPRVLFSEEFDAPAQQVVASACELGLEGVIAKRLGSRYASQRSSDWLKLKCGLRQEFVVGGYTEPKGSRTGLGALLLGVHGEDGALRYAGSVGTGFDQETLADLRERLEGLGTRQSPFAADAQPTGKPHWVRPELVAEVAFAEWTREGRVRHAVFHGLRSDKPPQAITRERPSPPAPASKGRASRLRRGPAPAETAAPIALPATLRVTHPERVVDTSTGTTKLDMVRFYAQVAPHMLPHLLDRPVALVRAPGGIDGELFFQKHTERYRLAGIVDLPRDIDPDHPALLAVAEAEGLLSAAQMNVIEFHTWNGVAADIHHPDRVTFDIDPGEGVAWAQVQEAATLVRAVLEELALTAFLKTSGGKGLHVVVPLAPEFGWDTVKAFSQAVVAHLSRTLPDRFVVKSGPRNRVGRIFIDYLRNGWGATTACAWSARARPGLGVSVPVGWEELAALESGAHWTVGTIDARLSVGNEPWADYEQRRAALRPALDAMGVPPG